MSGGHFNYKQHEIERIADEIEELQKNNAIPDQYGHAYDFSPETLKHFATAGTLLRIAYLYVHEIDWLVSGDTSEESFIRRLEEKLQALSNTATTSQ